MPIVMKTKDAPAKAKPSTYQSASTEPHRGHVQSEPLLGTVAARVHILTQRAWTPVPEGCPRRRRAGVENELQSRSHERVTAEQDRRARRCRGTCESGQPGVADSAVAQQVARESILRRRPGGRR